MRGFIGGRSTHNTRIERLWREHNNNVMDHFLAIFSKLEEIGMLNRHDNIDVWTLHKVFLSKIQQKLDEFRSYYNDHPIRSANGKTPKQMHVTAGLRDQVINSVVSPETSCILSDWQDVWNHNHVNHVEVPQTHDLELSEDQMSVIHTYMDENISDKNKYANVRSCVRQFMSY